MITSCKALLACGALALTGCAAVLEKVGSVVGVPAVDVNADGAVDNAGEIVGEVVGKAGEELAKGGVPGLVQYLVGIGVVAAVAGASYWLKRRKKS